MKFSKINLIILTFMSIWLRVSSKEDSDESSSHEDQLASICRAYVDKYGFLEDEKSCKKYCCGGCHKRYCCNKKLEAFTNQDACVNNYDLSNVGSGPVKQKICLAYYDNNENILPEKTCYGNEFCSGTCSKRFCGNKAYEWFDQFKCQNGINLFNTTTQSNGTVIVSSTVKYMNHKLNKIFYFIGFGLATVGFLLLIYKLMTNLFEQESKLNSKSNKMEILELKQTENDKPPPYPGY